MIKDNANIMGGGWKETRLYFIHKKEDDIILFALNKKCNDNR